MPRRTNSSLTMLPDGVQHLSLQSFSDLRGSVLKMLSTIGPIPLPIGEIYFSTTNPFCSKGWKLHTRVAMACCCIHGELELYLYDNRISSVTRYLGAKVNLSPDEHSLLYVPPGVWYGIKSKLPTVSILSVVISEPHDPSESLTSSETLSTTPTHLASI